MQRTWAPSSDYCASHILLAAPTCQADRAYQVVAPSVAEYVAMAVRLGTDATENARVRAEIEQRVAVLYGDQAGVAVLGDWLSQVAQEAATHC